MQGTDVDVVVGSVGGVTADAGLGAVAKAIPATPASPAIAEKTASRRRGMSSPPVDDNDAHPERHRSAAVVGALPAEAVAAELPRLAGAIRRALASRGVSLDEAEDIAQEAVTRALAETKPFASVEHLDGWCFLTAWRLATDRWRRGRRHPQTDLVPDLAVGDGLDRPVQYKAALHELLDAIGSLTPGQQRALVRILRADFAAQQEFLVALDSLPPGRRAPLERMAALLAEPLAGPASATDRWARHDLRARLRKLVHDFPAVVVARLRPLLRALPTRPSGKTRWLATAAMVGATAAVSLLVALDRAEVRDPTPRVVVAAPGAAEMAKALDADPPRPPRRPALAPGLEAARVPTAPPAPPPGGGRVNVLRFDDPGGGVGRVDLVPNGPGKPLACAGAEGQGACLSKPVSLRLPPLWPRG